MARIDLASLSPSELYSLLYVMWMEYQLDDEDMRRVRNEFTRSMMESVVDPNEEIEDPGEFNPFPGVMKTGPAGTIGS